MLRLDVCKLNIQGVMYCYNNSYGWNCVYFDEKSYLDKSYGIISACLWVWIVE